ncbi:MAG TPA: ROK family protein, partial [Steroidobacteraceae bacterium]|nr:ROK family protein [Steroidobacteraceae bacterium]
MIQLGVDFGGTKIEAAALSESGEFLARVRAPNPGSYDAAIGTVCALVDRVEAAVGDAQTIGVGIPGSPSPLTGLIRNSNSVWLNGRSLKADLGAALGRPIRIANDANCLALSEAVDGAARDSKITFAVIIGTGCGGGLVIDGQLVKGANRVSGEWGHIALPAADLEQGERPRCWCGRASCLEMWISGSGMQRDHQTRYGEKLTSEAIIAQMRAGNSHARATLDRYVDRLGRGLGVICNVIDPDTIVFGGGLSNVPEIFAALPDAIRPHVFSDTWSATLAPARWGDSSGVRGAARLWPLPPHDESLATTSSLVAAPPIATAAARAVPTPA